MRVYKSAVFAIVAFTLGAMSARAQNALPIAVTPFVAMGSDGASPIGVALTVPISPALRVETDVAYRRGEGNIHAPSTNASLIFSLPRTGRFTPYGAVGAGLARYGETAIFRLFDGSLQPGIASRLAATANFGGGITTRITDRMDFELMSDGSTHRPGSRRTSSA